MPRRLTAAQQARVQAENRARFDTEAALLLPAVRAALNTYLAAVTRRVDQSAFGLAAPPPVLVAAGPIAQPAGPDPHQFTTGHAEQLQAVFDNAAPEWSAAMQTGLMPGIKAMLGRIPIPSDHPDVITAAESWRSEWLAERTQILVGVPDTVTASIRAELDRLATEQGTSVFDAKNAITDLLSPDRLAWEAQRIARTECLPGDAVVTAANAHTLYRRWYSGKWIEVETDSGRKVAGTPNHPVLTTRGWVGLGQLTEDDRLICHGASVEKSGAPGDVDVEHPPSPIAEVFEAAAAVVVGERARTGQPDFHGDGMDGYVDVLAPDRVLRVGNFTPVEQGGCDRVLAPADVSAVLFAAASAPYGARLTVDQRARLRRAANGYAGLLHDAPYHPASDAVLGGKGVGGLAVGIAGGNLLGGKVESGAGGAEPASVLGACSFGVSPHRSVLKDDPVDYGGRGASSPTGQTDAGTAQVHIEHVRLVNVTTFGGHVYNLSTTDGYFAINGVYTGNTVAANNNGMLASWRSLIGTMGAGATATKTWIGGQRPTHSAVSGTTIGIDEKFHVGDSEMDGPGDGAGGPGEVVNCACSLSFTVDDAPQGSDGSDQTATMTAAADPDDEWALTAAGDTPNTGACLMAYLTAEDANRLAVPGGEPAENLHVTLAYLDRPAVEFTPEEQAEIDAAFAAAWVGPVTADAFGTALFNPDSEERDPCAVLLVQSDDLCNARDAMLAALDTVPIGSPVGLDDTFPIWIPHTAIAYNAADASIIAPGSTGPLVYDRLVMAWGPDQHDLTTPAAEPDPEPEPVQALTAATQEQPMTAPTDTPPAPTASPAVAVPEAAGVPWSGPLCILGAKSSDRRKLTPNGTIRPLPQPLNWQEKSAPGHDGSVVVGRCLTVEIRDGLIFGSGDYLPGYNEDVDKARQQVDSGLGLVSVDVVPGVVSFEDIDGNPIDPSTYTGDMDDVVVVYDEWEFGGVTIISFPAFAEARIANDPGTETDDDITGGPHIMPGQIETFAGENPAAPTVSDDGTTVTLTDGTKVGVGDPVTFPGEDGADTAGTITSIDPAGLTVTVTLTPDGDADVDDQAEPQTVTIPISDLTAAGDPIDGTPDAASTFSAEDVDVLLASSAAHPYPAAAFAKRELLGPTPLTLNRETGEVYGHFAQWGECHIGKLAQDGVCVTPPQSAAGYDYFHLGEVITDAGPLPVGKVTVGGGHAGPRVGFRGAVEHYDRTCTQVAVIRAYDDAYGGQFTGMLIPGVDPEKVEEMMRAGQLSGDWRTMKGNLELVAALAVNVPGFPVKRPAPSYGMVGGRQVSLVAAGMVIPEENTDVVLPSGQTLPRDDWEALVAAAFTALQQHTTRAPEPVKELPVVDQLALRRATARLALLNTEAV